MLEWIPSALANVVRVVVTWWRDRVRVNVELDGPLGLDQPHGRQYMIVVANRGKEPVGVVRAELEVVSAGKWRLVASPHSQVTIAGRHQERWTLPATDVRALLVNKNLYEARVRGVARLGTGGTRRSEWQRIHRPRAASV